MKLKLTRRFGLIATVLALFVLGGATVAMAVGSPPQSTDVYRFDTGADVGDARLVRTDSGVTMRISSSVEGNLFEFPDFEFPGDELGPLFSPGDATTNWFVVFNNPGDCFSTPCGENDIINSVFEGVIDDTKDAQVDILFATGHVAGSQWRAAAHLAEGDTSGSIRPALNPNTNAIGLIDGMTAEVHVIVRSHGPASDLAAAGEVASAISSVEGGCSINTCGDAQFAIFLP